MRVLFINGSPHTDGNTAIALREMQKIFEENGVEVEWIQIGNKAIRGCVGCQSCRRTGKCVFEDEVNQTAEKLRLADGVVIGSPVYYASVNATLLAFLTRLFYSAPFSCTMKVGAAVVAARRGGLTASYDEINKFFAISGMPIATGQYWNGIHGMKPGEAAEDAEGLQMMRTLARNMLFLMKSIALGRESYGLPEKESPVMTNFIR